MDKPPFSLVEAAKVSTISNQIEGYEPVLNKNILKKVKSYISKNKKIIQKEQGFIK